MRITVAGASGFVGKRLVERLVSSHTVRGLSRNPKKGRGDVKWVKADLFSFKSVDSAIKDTDVAIYLVHSMLPTSRLFQGNFQDTDLILADNFARACKKNKVKQIIYLGGLEPTNSSSKHLESRKEVEQVFRSTGVPTTVLRAGMVVGDGGSSFEILKNLVLNLPVMILPSWTKSTTQAIFVDDLLSVIEHCVSHPILIDRTVNVVNGENITYDQLIRQASEYFTGGRLLIPVPINYTSFSKLWVQFFGQSDYELVSPLIDSLTCDLASPKIPKEIEHLVKYRSFKSMLREIPKERKIRNYRTKKEKCNNVRSIQRLSGKAHLNAHDISELYVEWLPRHLKNIIQVTWHGDYLNFSVAGIKKPLLVLRKQSDNEDLERIKFHIIGGLLTKTKNTGWLEFRKVAGGQFTLASINNFVPSLPWYIYKYSQALVHLRVMQQFSKFLSKSSNKV